MADRCIFRGHLCVEMCRHRVAVVIEIDFAAIAGRKAHIVERRSRILRILGTGQQLVLGVIVLGEQFHFSRCN